jgi:hypothetical protein
MGVPIARAGTRAPLFVAVMLTAQSSSEIKSSSKALRARVRDSCKEMQRFVESLEVRAHTLVTPPPTPCV